MNDSNNIELHSMDVLGKKLDDNGKTIITCSEFWYIFKNTLCSVLIYRKDLDSDYRCVHVIKDSDYNRQDLIPDYEMSLIVKEICENELWEDIKLEWLGMENSINN